MADKKEWKDVKDAGAIERMMYELDCIQEKINLLYDLASSTEADGHPNYGTMRLIAQSLKSDRDMITYELGKVQEIPAPEPKGTGWVEWVKIPVFTKRAVDDGLTQDLYYRQEWIDYYKYAVDNDQTDNYFYYDGDSDILSTEFSDWIYAEITASVTVARQDSKGKAEFGGQPSDDAVAWAWEMLFDSKSLY